MRDRDSVLVYRAGGEYYLGMARDGCLIPDSSAIATESLAVRVAEERGYRRALVATGYGFRVVRLSPAPGPIYLRPRL